MGLVDSAFSLALAVVTRLRTRKGLFIIFTFSVAVLFLYTTAVGSIVSEWIPSPDLLPFGKTLPGFCTPDEYANGKWVYRKWFTRPGPLTKTDLSKPQPQSYDGPPINMTGDWGPDLSHLRAPESAMKWARFQGCASTREWHWHMAADNYDHVHRFPGLFEWEWIPGGRCSRDENGLREFEAEEVIRELVEGGGWLMVGDSVTENHFFSLSCLLYPHVIATPNYRLQNWWDRSWEQNLYLNPDSPLLKDDPTTLITKTGASQKARRKLQLPPNFNITGTPLATFRRVDLFWSQDEVAKIHKETHPEFYTTNASFSLWGDEESWTLSPDVYLDIFMRERPQGNYKTMIVSTGGHWTTHLFAGYGKPEGKGEDSTGAVAEPGVPLKGYDGLLQFYGELMEKWADRVQATIDEGEKKKQGSYPPPKGTVPQQRQVIFRAYMPGHVHCHDYNKPVTTIPPIKGTWWNWQELHNYNAIVKKLLSNPKYKNMHFLQIERPGRLRPDAHATGDCLHMMTGSGVMEGWTHYIWHYLTREL